MCEIDKSCAAQRRPSFSNAITLKSECSSSANKRAQQISATRRRYQALVAAMSIIEKGETWAESFKRQKADPPSEILPGLYLSNIKTAAAYLTGQVDGDHSFPRITRMVTVLSEDHHTIGIDRFPVPQGSGKSIERIVISKYDGNTTNLIEDFDKTSKFIHEGLEAHRAVVESQTHSFDQQIVMQVEKDSSSTSNEAVAWSLSRGFGSAASKLRKRSSSSCEFNTAYETEFMDQTDSTTPAQIPSEAAQVQPPSTSYATPSQDGVLVHCHSGISRSSTIVIAYLLKYHRYLFAESVLSPRQETKNTSLLMDRMTTDRAIEFVVEKRLIVKPNLSFRVQLAWYLHKLDCSITDPRTGEVKEEYKDFLVKFDDPGYASSLVQPIESLVC